MDFIKKFLERHEMNSIDDCKEIRKELSLIKESIDLIEAELDKIRPVRISERQVYELLEELEKFGLGLRLQKDNDYYSLFNDNVALS